MWLADTATLDGKVYVLACKSKLPHDLLLYKFDSKTGKAWPPIEVKQKWRGYDMTHPVFIVIHQNKIICIGCARPHPAAMNVAATIRLVMDLEGNVLEAKQYRFGLWDGDVTIDESGRIHLVTSYLSLVDKNNIDEYSLRYVVIDSKGEMEEKTDVGKTRCQDHPAVSCTIRLDPQGTVHIYYTEPKRVGKNLEWKLNHVQHRGKSPAKGTRLPAFLRTAEDEIIYIIDKNGKEKEVRMPK